MGASPLCTQPRSQGLHYRWEHTRPWLGLDTCLSKSLSLGTRLLCILVTGLKFLMNRCQLHLGKRASPVNQALIQTTQCGKVLFFCAIHKEVEVTIAYPSKVASLYEAGRLGGLGPVSRKSRNFTGHFWVSQFLVYLIVSRGDPLLTMCISRTESRQTSHLFFFLFPW